MASTAVRVLLLLLAVTALVAAIRILLLLAIATLGVAALRVATLVIVVRALPVAARTVVLLGVGVLLSLVAVSNSATLVLRSSWIRGYGQG